jgi:hypothetical protein
LQQPSWSQGTDQVRSLRRWTIAVALVLQEIYYELVPGWSCYIHAARKLDLEAVDLTVVLEKANLHAILVEYVS